jgi:hypothetical protein
MKLQTLAGLGSLVNAFLMVAFLADMFKAQASDFSGPHNLMAYVGIILSGMAYILIVFALKERMQERVPNLMSIAVIGVSVTCALWFATGTIGIVGMPPIVSAKDPSAYRVMGAMLSSLPLAGDFTVGWVLLLIGGAALKTKEFSRILSCLFVLKGAVMILSIAVASLQLVGILLGLLFYPWLGVVLLRSKEIANVPHPC